MPRINLISSRLAARAEIRQVDAIVRADAVASAADRAVLAAWRKVLAVLRADRGAVSNYHAAREAFRGLYAALHRAVGDGLAGLARWGHRSAVRDLKSTLPRRYLLTVSVRRRLKEDDDPEPAFGFRELMDLIFPPPSEAEVARVVYGAAAGQSWQQRLASLSRLASPDLLAATVARGMHAGKTQQEIAKELAPLVQNVRSSARRVARTEGMRVANAMQMKAHAQLGDLVVGYQIRATLDQFTRSWHASRSGTVYYLHPKPGQKGPAQMPHPPDEAQDPRERPARTPKVAAN